MDQLRTDIVHRVQVLSWDIVVVLFIIQKNFISTINNKLVR